MDSRGARLENFSHILRRFDREAKKSNLKRSGDKIDRWGFTSPISRGMKISPSPVDHDYFGANIVNTQNNLVTDI